MPIDKFKLEMSYYMTVIDKLNDRNNETMTNAGLTFIKVN